MLVTPPPSPDAIAAYQPVGCYRSLRRASLQPGSAPDVPSCMHVCALRKAFYLLLSAAGDCRCTDLHPDTDAAISGAPTEDPLPDGDCDLACPGDGAPCGGSAGGDVVFYYKSSFRCSAWKCNFEMYLRAV